MTRRLSVLLFVLAPLLVHAAAPANEINACSLLTSAEISKAIGLGVDAGRRQDEGSQPNGSYSSSCIWMIAAGKEQPANQSPRQRHRFVILTAMQWPAGKDLARTFLETFRSAAANGVIASKPVSRKFGDEALWWGDGLAVRKGDVSFGVSVFMPSPGVARTSAMEEKLAPHILRRLNERVARDAV
ncbi:MAG: hypothetical protein ABW106_06895 [Steroidobacteraceae bacterium]